MEHSVRLDVVRPWRTATLVASGVAALELVVIVGAGVALLGEDVAAQMQNAAAAEVLAPAKPAPTKNEPAPLLDRAETSVMVLNGNGRAGAAAENAAAVRTEGYSVGSVGNAPRSDYGDSVVMYRPGNEREAQRLADDLGVKIVGPLDGLQLEDLMGAHLVLVVGN